MYINMNIASGKCSKCEVELEVDDVMAGEWSECEDGDRMDLCRWRGRAPLTADTLFAVLPGCSMLTCKM